MVIEFHFKLLYFSGYRIHFSPQVWEENEGASYSPNVAYLAHYSISALKDVIRGKMAAT